MRRAASSAVRAGVDRLTTHGAPGHAGAPAPLDILLTWTVVAAVAHWCFVRLPGRLEPQLSLVTRSYSSYNDFAWAAHYVNQCLLLWTCYDVLLRVMCLVWLPVDILTRLHFPLPSTAGTAVVAGTSTADLAQPPMLLPVGVLPLVDAARVTLVGDSIYDRANRDVAGVAGGWHGTYSMAVCATSAVCFCGVALMVWRGHSRPYLAGTLPEQTLTMRDLKTGESVPLPRQYQVRVGLLPKSFWMLLWTLAFLTAFAVYRAMPLLTGSVFPVCVCLLLVLEVLMP